jgi:regulator of sigma E protease
MTLVSIGSLWFEVSPYVAGLFYFVAAANAAALFHELGHFLVARRYGIRVDVFSLGFGPEILGFTGRQGTRWKLAAIPLGGYVKFSGHRAASSASVSAKLRDPSAHVERLSRKLIFERSAIFGAGPIFSFMLAFVIYVAVFALYGRNETGIQVEFVEPDSAAAASGLRADDFIVSIEGGVESVSELQHFLCADRNLGAQIEIDRHGDRTILEVKGKLCDVTNSHAAEIAEIGFSRGRVFKSVPVPPITAVELGLEETLLTMKRAFAYFPQTYGLVLVHHHPRDPTSSTAVLERLPREENARLLCLIGGLSVILGLFSLLPLPPFDGGQLLLCGVETVSGRRIQDEPLKYLSWFGLTVMLFLMILSVVPEIVSLLAE